MALTLNDLAIHKDYYNPADILEDWDWNLDGSFSALMPTVLGHIFLERSDQSIWLLDTWSAVILPVSESYEAFRTSLTSSEEFIRYWFFADVVGVLLDAGMKRQPDQCYSSHVSPGLGGSLKPQNFMTTSLKVHLATTAAEWASIKGIPHA